MVQSLLNSSAVPADFMEQRRCNKRLYSVTTFNSNNSWSSFKNWTSSPLRTVEFQKEGCNCISQACQCQTTQFHLETSSVTEFQLKNIVVLSLTTCKTHFPLILRATYAEPSFPLLLSIFCNFPAHIIFHFSRFILPARNLILRCNTVVKVGSFPVFWDGSGSVSLFLVNTV